MQDILFDIQGKIIGTEESTRTHQQDLLIINKGWNKFYPHCGVGIMDYINDEGDPEQLRSNITYEFERDGMQVKNIILNSTGKINIDATY